MLNYSFLILTPDGSKNHNSTIQSHQWLGVAKDTHGGSTRQILKSQSRITSLLSLTPASPTDHQIRQKHHSRLHLLYVYGTTLSKSFIHMHIYKYFFISIYLMSQYIKGTIENYSGSEEAQHLTAGMGRKCSRRLYHHSEEKEREAQGRKGSCPHSDTEVEAEMGQHWGLIGQCSFHMTRLPITSRH